MTVQVAGAGPAGTSAALAALRCGVPVDLYERSRMPRHKVCGEFLSGGVLEEFERAGVSSAILDANPSRIQRAIVHTGGVSRSARLPGGALGLSRYRLDQILLDKAAAMGASVHWQTLTRSSSPVVRAVGRAQRGGEKAQQLFGFKAHFTGPASDAVELYFEDRCYVGVSCIEGGVTNVCGLTTVERLSGVNFEVDEIVKILERLRPLQRSTPWIFSGPLVFGFAERQIQSGVYPAGDALSFVDPFTGTGQLLALITGRLAGQAAAQGRPIAEYLAQCEAGLRRPMTIATLIRKAMESRQARFLTALAPIGLLYRSTRPSLGHSAA